MKTCALVGAADFNATRFCAMDDAGMFDYVIAVDGGFAHLEAIGRTPNMAIGDFDSLGYVPRGLHVVRKPTRKDESDMELALMRAKSQRFDAAYAFGALGKRLDHTMANMHLFAKFTEAGLPLTAVGDGEIVMFLSGPHTLELPARESGIVSVFALSDTCYGVFERGLAWELDDYTLTNRTSLGLSNEFKGEAALIGVSSGTLAIIMPF